MFSDTSVLGAMAAIAAACFTVIWTAWYRYAQLVVKLRSDWIDAFRNEVSSLASSMHTIIILWEAKLECQDPSKKELSKEDFETFRSDNKELYEMAFKYCSAVRMHLHFIPEKTIPKISNDELKRKQDEWDKSLKNYLDEPYEVLKKKLDELKKYLDEPNNEVLGMYLDNTIIALIKDLLGNTRDCGRYNRKIIKIIILIANRIIDNKVNDLKSMYKWHKRWKNIILVILLLFIFYAIYSLYTKPNQEISISQVLDNQNNFIKKLTELTDKQNIFTKSLTENQSNCTKINTLLEDLCIKINNIANLEEEVCNLKQLSHKHALPKKNPKTKKDSPC